MEENHPFIIADFADFCCVIWRNFFRRDSVLVFFSTLCISHSALWNLGNSLSLIYSRKFVKITILLNELLVRCPKWLFDKFNILEFERGVELGSQRTKFLRATGCPRSKVSKTKGYISVMKHILPHNGKAKMCLKDIHFCMQNQLFVHIKYKIIKNANFLQPSFHGLMVKD